MHTELAEHLDALKRDECYRVDAVLKKSAHERTERVFFVGANGAELGPFVRKSIDLDAGMGNAYRSIFAAQERGCRFRHLPRIVECTNAGSCLVVVMECVQGETLAEVVYRCDPSLALARDVFPQLCDAVCELHEGFDPPLIHRDLKPSNIMLSRSGLTIIDFGIARTFNEGGNEDTRCFGTRGYAPPEQFGFGQTDVRSDVYALGLLLRFCLTEQAPEADPCLRASASGLVPEPLQRVIARATAFDPAARHASARELKEAFLVAAASGSLDTLPVAFPRTAPPAAFSGAAPKRRLWERVPLVGGSLRNAVVCLLFLMLFASATQLAFFPKEAVDTAIVPFALRALSYYVLLFFIFGPTFYLVADRKALRQRIPALQACPPGRDVAVCIALFVAGFVMVGVLGQFVSLP